MSLITETLKAYGVDIAKTPVNPRILIPDHGEREGIIVEQFIKDDTGEYIVAGEEMVTGMIFFPEPADDGNSGEDDHTDEEQPEPITLEDVKAEPLRMFTSKGRNLNYIGVEIGIRLAKNFTKDATDEELFQSIYGPAHWKENNR